MLYFKYLKPFTERIEMPNKVYLIDTENVKSEWKCVLDKLGKRDLLLLFYTENSPNVSFADFSNLVNYPFKYEMLPCFPGKNGLDFQLVTYLGYLLRKNPLREYVILSNDTGFDAVVYFWTGKGKKVSRLSTQALHGENGQVNPNSEWRKDRNFSGKQRTKRPYDANGNTRAGQAGKKNGKSVQKSQKPTSRNDVKRRTPEKIQQDTTLKLKEILEVQKGIDFSWLYGELKKHTMDDLQEIHKSMVHKWGQEEGTALYKKLKPRIKEVYKVMKDWQ